MTHLPHPTSLSGYRPEATRAVHLRQLSDDPYAGEGMLDIEGAPEIPPTEKTPLLPKIMPIVMVVGILGSVVWMARSGGRLNPMMLMFPLMMAASAGSMLSTSLKGGSVAELIRRRQYYLRYLGEMKDQCEERQRAFREHEETRFPHGTHYRAVLESRQFWHIFADDDDYLCLRIARGSRGLHDYCSFPEMPREQDLEPVSVSALQLFAQQTSIIHNVPIIISVKGFGRITVTGNPARAEGLFRSLLVTLLFSHHPEDCTIVLACRDPQWLELLKWAPHVVRRGDAELYPRNLLDPDDSGDVSQISQTALILISDDPEYVEERGPYFATVIALLPEDSEMSAGIIVDVNDEGDACGVVGDEYCHIGPAEFLSYDQAETALCALSGYCDADKAGGDTVVMDEEDTRPRDLFALLGMGEVQNFRAQRDWLTKSGRDRLRIPFGLGTDDNPVYLDIKESAQGGMGPHGLCIGATGSGKSELLRTLVTSLMASHSPEQVNLVLIDFKGGATFSGLSDAPHVAGCITNLANDNILVDRMHEVLQGELHRRQEILHAAGSFANIDDYNKARSRGQVDTRIHPHLPALFVIVDEFTELLEERSDFLDLFVQIGRLGRSLHVHLLLATQRLDPGKLRGLDSHLSYRLILKTFSPSDASSFMPRGSYHSDLQPGGGFLTDGDSIVTQFQSFYVSGKVQHSIAASESPQLEALPSGQCPVQAIEIYGVSPTGAPQQVDSGVALTTPTYVTVPDTIHEHAGIPGKLDFSALMHATQHPELWEKPLVESSLTTPQKEDASARSLSSENTTDHSTHSTAQEHQQEKRTKGNGESEKVAVENTVYQELLQHFPAEAQQAHQIWLPPLPTVLSAHEAIHLVSHSQFSFDAAASYTPGSIIGVVDMPAQQMRQPMWITLSHFAHGVVGGTTHCGKSQALVTIAAALCRENSPSSLKIYAIDAGGGALQRIAGLPQCAVVCALQDEERRERTLAEVIEYINRRARGEESSDQHILLIIDGWAAFVENNMEEEEKIRQIARQGLSYNVHLLISTVRWADVRPAIRDAITVRWEMHLSDRGDSFVSSPRQAGAPNLPGRGVTEESLHYLFVFHTDEELEEICEKWQDEEPVVPLSLLPTHVGIHELPAPTRSTHKHGFVLPLGYEGQALGPYCLDTGQMEHLLVVGDHSGKSTFLRSFIRQLTSIATPEEAQFLLVDYRRQLLGCCPEEYLSAYSSTRNDVYEMVCAVHERLEQRMPTGVTDPQVLRDRSWWSGPEVFLIVDDYDLVSTSSGNPLQQLTELIPYGRDIGLHIIVARRCTGFGRATYEAFMARIRELNPLMLLMNGSPEEGAIMNGRKPRALIPGRIDTRDENGLHLTAHLAYDMAEEEESNR